MTERTRVTDARGALERRRTELWDRMGRGELSFEEAMGRLGDWEVETGDGRLLLHPPTGEWLVYDRLHDTYIPLGVKAGRAASGAGPSMVCPTCGVTSAPGDLFCGGCGSSLETAALSCSRCGASAPPGASFCVSCGSPVRSVGRRRRPRLTTLLRTLTMVGGLTLTGIGVAQALADRDPPPSDSIAEAPLVTSTASLPPTTSVTAETIPVTATQPAGPGEVTPTAPQEMTCRDDGVGFSVDYPSGWHVAGTELDGPCAYFDPEPFEASGSFEDPVAIAVYWTDWSFADLVASYDSDGAVIQERESFRLAGRKAQRLLYTFTGDGGGASGYDVIVQHAGGTLVLTTFEAFSGDFDATRRVVDDMAASLDLESR
ncbi:MAG TPA: zinc ribbon domain-containing protein [Acidimicrobiia bacterium]